MVRSRNTTTSTVYEEPVAIQRNVPEIFQIFHNVQFNTIQHKKYIKELKKVFHKLDSDAFNTSFANALHYTFLFGEANGNVDRVMQFVANFLSSLNDDDFMHLVFDIIFDCVAVAGQGVRARACQLLGLILSCLGEDAELDDDLCDKIMSTQLERLQDIRGAVRRNAVVALQRLQNPSDEDDPVTRAYTFHMSCDPSPAVRRSVVLSLAKNSRNLLHILERLRDVDESVRKAAFLYIASISVTQLKVRQRVHILKVGLQERSPRVRKVVETALLPGWLGAYHGNVLDLLAAIRLDNVQGAKDSAIVAGNLLQSLFKNQQITELLEWLPVDPKIKLISAEHLGKESAWYWRHLARHLHSIEDTDHLEQVLPELITFTGYVRSIVESACPDEKEHPVEFSKRQYILQELFQIFPVYDMADEVGKNALKDLLYNTLTGNHGPLDTEVIRAIMRDIDLVVPDIKKRVEFVAEIISEIHEPATSDEVIPLTPATPIESNEIKIMRAELRVALNEAQEEQEDAVRAQNFVLAADCKEKVDALNKKLLELNANLKETISQPQPILEVVREKKNDPDTLNKCITILNLMMDTPDIKTLTPVLKSLFQNFELMLYQNPEIKENALQTVALYSMLDEEFAKEQKAFFFAQFMDMDNTKLVTTALKCVIDVICVHGVKIFNIEDDNNDSNKSQSKSKNSDDEGIIEDSEEDEDDIFQISSKSKNKSGVNKSKVNKSKIHKSKKKSEVNKSKKSNIVIPDSDNEDEDKQVGATPSAHDAIIELFLRLMDSECSEYRVVIVEGLCRLLIAGRLSSPSLLSRLLLLWFNPATEDEDDLRQILGTFFPLFAIHTETGMEQLEGAFMPTVMTLAKAPLGSPLAEVDQESMLKFIIGLTRPTSTPNAHNIHSNLAIQICSTLERGEELAMPILCRALALLMPPRLPQLCRDLLKSADYLMESVSDKLSYRNVARFHANISIALENLERKSTLELDTLSENTERRSSVNTSCAPADTDSDTPKPIDERVSSEGDRISIDEGNILSSTTTSDAKTDCEGSTKSTKSNMGSEVQVQFEDVVTPPKKIRRITSADVARRALKKTPKVIRTVSDSPLPIPSRALETKSEPETPGSVRRSGRARQTPAKFVKETVVTKRKKNSSGESEDDGKKKNTKSAKSLDKKLKEAATNAEPPKKKSTNKKTFEMFDIKEDAAKKARGRGRGKAKVPVQESEESSSSSEEPQIDDSSEDDTVLHTICHDTSQQMGTIDDSSDEDERQISKNVSQNKIIEESTDSSDPSSESSDEDALPVPQNRYNRRK